MGRYTRKYSNTGRGHVVQYVLYSQYRTAYGTRCCMYDIRQARYHTGSSGPAALLSFGPVRSFDPDVEALIPKRLVLGLIGHGEFMLGVSIMGN